MEVQGTLFSNRHRVLHKREVHSASSENEEEYLSNNNDNINNN